MPGIAPRGGGCLARGPAQPPGPGRGLLSLSVLPTGPSFRCHTHLARANCWRLITATHPDEATNSSGAGEGTRPRASHPLLPASVSPLLSLPGVGAGSCPGGCGAGKGGAPTGTSSLPITLGAGCCPHWARARVRGPRQMGPCRVRGFCLSSTRPADGGCSGAGAGAVAEGWRAPCPGDAAPFVGLSPRAEAPSPGAPRASFQLST